MDIEDLPNAEEVRKWIASFKRVMKKCPGNLWFFSNGELSIMATNENGENMYRQDTGGVDPDYKIDDESSHLWEGGDW